MCGYFDLAMSSVIWLGKPLQLLPPLTDRLTPPKVTGCHHTCTSHPPLLHLPSTTPAPPLHLSFTSPPPHLHLPYTSPAPLHYGANCVGFRISVLLAL